jgi:hypothetical protein
MVKFVESVRKVASAENVQIVLAGSALKAPRP